MFSVEALRPDGMEARGGIVETGPNTDVIRVPAAGQQQRAPRTEAAAQLSTVAAIIDLVRPPGGRLRILEIGGGETSLAEAEGPDEIVSLGDPGQNGASRRFDESAFDCAISIDTVHRLDPAERRALLARLRRAATCMVMVESPRASNEHNPLEEAIELFREFGDSVLVVGEEHLPALFALRELPCQRALETVGRTARVPWRSLSICSRRRRRGPDRC